MKHILFQIGIWGTLALSLTHHWSLLDQILVQLIILLIYLCPDEFED